MKIELLKPIINNNVSAKRIGMMAVPFATVGTALVSSPAKDVFVKNNDNVNTTAFIEEFLSDKKNKKIDTVLKTFEFEQFGTKGVPLSYSRKNFVEDVKDVDSFELGRYGLEKNDDIDGIAFAPKSQISDVRLKNGVDKLYNNESVSYNSRLNYTMNTLLKGMPEFAMIMGKVQHKTHIYSVDIHTLINLQKSMNNPLYETLSDEGKMVLKLSVLMHDFGKKGGVITPGHAEKSAEYATRILQRYNLSDEVKERVVNHVANHHWFEKFNKGNMDVDGVKEMFKTPEDVCIAKIMAKADLESIGNGFHRKVMGNWVMISQEEFEKRFDDIMSKID